MSFRTLLPGLVAALSLAACERAPRIDAPVPRFAPSGAPAPAPDGTPSALAIPVTVQVATLLGAADDALPREWGSLDSARAVDPDRPPIALEVWREELGGSMDGVRARIETVVHYRMKSRVDLPLLPDPGASCGIEDPAPRLRVRASAPLTLDDRWRLRMGEHDLTIAPLTNEERDRCEVTLLDIDVTDRLIAAAEEFAGAHRAAIDSLVGAVDVRSSFESWWALLSEPVDLGEGVWLSIRPESIAVRELRGEGDRIRMEAVLEARPRIQLGSRPDPTSTPLPPLDSGDEAPDVEGLVARVETYTEFPALSRHLSDEVRGHELGVANRRMTVRSLELSGLGEGRVAVAVRVGGDLEGTLYLVGRPVYDATTGEVHLDDLRFDADTNEILLRVADWVLDSGAVALIADRARWSLDDLADWSTRTATRGMNSSLAPGIRLRGALDSLRVVQLVTERDRFRVLAEVRGRLALEVSPEGD